MTILTHRPRRLRKNIASRNLIAENYLSANDLIYPVFIVDGQNKRQPISAMPDVYRLSIDNLVKELDILTQLGLLAVALFPVISSAKKDLAASESFNADGLLPKAIKKIKKTYPTLLVITDIALDPYTSHGQDGIIDKFGYVLNDQTVDILVKQALMQAAAGADIVAPSDMMDGRIGAIRKALEENNYTNTQILAYAVKYASNYYAPFRDAIGSSANLSKTDKKTYQMNPANSNEALQEVALDLAQGADMIMVKPGVAYLDIIYRIKQKFKAPTLAYQVSAEYAMLKAASKKGWINEKALVLETLLSFKRAGADAILSYYTKEVLKWLQKQND